MRNTRYIEVDWHNKPVFIENLTVKQTQDELGFQVYCNQWLISKGYVFWHHSANERKGGLSGWFAKIMGQSPGFPDFIHPTKGGGLAIELKRPGRKVSKEQLDWLAYFKSIGWHSEVVRSFERFREVVEAV